MLSHLQREIDQQEEQSRRMQSELESAVENLAMVAHRAVQHVHPRERSRSRSR